MKLDISQSRLNHDLNKAKAIADKLTMPISLSVWNPIKQLTSTKRRGKIVSFKASLSLRLI
jgi:hypothetical protein